MSTNLLFVPVNTDKIHWSLIVRHSQSIDIPLIISIIMISSKVVYLVEHRVVFFDSLLWERERYARLVM